MFKVEPSNKINKDEFINYMENKGCTITDIQKEMNYSSMNDYLVTEKDSYPYFNKLCNF